MKLKIYRPRLAKKPNELWKMILFWNERKYEIRISESVSKSDIINTIESDWQVRMATPSARYIQ